MRLYLLLFCESDIKGHNSKFRLNSVISSLAFWSAFSLPNMVQNITENHTRN